MSNDNYYVVSKRDENGNTEYLYLRNVGKAGSYWEWGEIGNIHVFLHFEHAEEVAKTADCEKNEYIFVDTVSFNRAKMVRGKK